VIFAFLIPQPDFLFLNSLNLSPPQLSNPPSPFTEPRFITNPPVALKQPFNFDRTDGNSGTYSLVEQKTLNALGQPQGLKGWKITTERRSIVPERVREQAQMKKI
jgi:hypothetical protein